MSQTFLTALSFLSQHYHSVSLYLYSEIGMSILYRYRQVSVVFLVGLLALSLTPKKAEAQRWLQTARIITPIEDGSVRALLDTLVNTLERNNDIKVLRSSDHQKPISVSKLRNKLLDEEGIGLSSATHVFIDYRFQMANKGFEEYIDSLFFIFRGGADEEDIPIMYIDTTEEWAKTLIEDKGTTPPTNVAPSALRPFREQLAFARIARRDSTTQIVEKAGRTVREGYEEKKHQLVQKVQQLTYEAQ